MTDEILPIRKIADKLGIADEYLDYYGPHTAKLKLSLMDETKPGQKGKLIMVTAITPTSYGEGKTVVSIGLAQALDRLGKKVIATLREPSLGPVFGVKGGATGGGKSRVLPSEKINLHFTGDFHAITTAHNLLAAAIDSHIHNGNELRFDVDSIFWPRAMDMNDRALRHIVVGLGGKINGVPRETGFVITAASEIMAIMGLATSREDLRKRINSIVVGFNLEGQIIRASDLNVTGSMMVLLNDAIQPNLVQTTEHTPAFVHTGPFANIAHGTSSVISQKIAFNMADYIVNESGFGADLGAEKFFDIVMTQTGHKPAAAVLIATVRALASHGGVPGDLSVEAVKRGLVNLATHLENMRKFKVPVVVAINRFTTDTPEQLDVIKQFCEESGVESALVDVFEKGGEGAIELAEKIMKIADPVGAETASPIYQLTDSLETKIEKVAKEIYGAGIVYIEAGARKKLKKFTDLGYGQLPICMAKTQSSLSDNPKLPGAPKGFTLTVNDASLSAGAGFVVVVAGSMMLMPGLPKVPQAFKIDVDENGVPHGVG